MRVANKLSGLEMRFCMVVWCVMAGLAWSGVAVAEDDRDTGKDRVSTKIDVKALEAEKASLKNRQKALRDVITDNQRWIHGLRRRQLRNDEDIVRLRREIEKKEAELERLARKKYPELAKRSQENETSIADYERIRSRLMEIDDLLKSVSAKAEAVAEGKKDQQ